MKGTVEERFWAKVEKTDDCWVWTASRIYSKGVPTYGQFGPQQGQNRPAHRFAYELLVGPIPDGHELHHVCRNKLCVNPDHLEVVTRKRHVTLQPLSGAPVLRRQKTHCPAGHPYSGGNLYVTPDGSRSCRACKARQAAEYAARNRETIRARARLRRQSSHLFVTL